MKIEEVKEKLNVNESELDDLYRDLDDYQRQVDDTQNVIDQKEAERKELKNQLDIAIKLSVNENPYEYLKYLLNDTNHEELKGQYCIYEMWTVCDGHILMDKPVMFDDLPIVGGAGCINFDSVVKRAEYPVCFDLEKAERMHHDIYDLIKVGVAWVNEDFVKLVIGLLGNPIRVESTGELSPTAWFCEKGRAIILPVRVRWE